MKQLDELVRGYEDGVVFVVVAHPDDEMLMNCLC